jgi:hypothetical protein
MDNFFEIFINLVNTVFDRLEVVESFVSGGRALSADGCTVAFTAILGLLIPVVATDGVIANMRRWHGSIDDQFNNIDNLVNIVVAHQLTWMMPEDLFAQLVANRGQLQGLINRCRSTAGSQADRTLRNSLLKSTVGLCLMQVRVWAYAQYTAGVLTAEDVHLLGFFLPGEHGGRRTRHEPTDVAAEVKVKVLNEDFIRVVIDRAAAENAAQVAHGWPDGVKMALIVITSVDGLVEVFRQFTTRLHNDVRMPEGSRGKQFIIKAAFLKHINDQPKFGNEPTFSMPLTTEDLVAALDKQHREDSEEHLKEIERQRKIIEELQKK